MPLTLSESDYSSLFTEAGLDVVDHQPDSLCPLPVRLGRGQQRSLAIRAGMDLTIEDYCLTDDLIVRHRDRPHPLEYSFERLTCRGRTEHHYHLWGSGLAPEEVWSTPGNQQVVRVNVHIEPALFQQWLGAAQDWLQVVDLLRSQDEAYYQRSGTSTPAMQMTVQQILTCPFEGLTQRLYLESKVWELMVLLVEDLFSPQASRPVAYTLKPDDVERIHYAGKILQKRLLNPPSLMELARAVGINDHKLKVGFHQVFDTTVFGYLHERRMERSRQLLEMGDVNVTEAARAVGFANRGHFAAAFRRKFGINPGIYLRQRRA